MKSEDCVRIEVWLRDKDGGLDEREGDVRDQAEDRILAHSLFAFGVHS